MKYTFFWSIIIATAIIFHIGCKRGPDIFQNNELRGFVLGKENCNADPTKDYWLIDFSYGSSNPNVGDTLILNGSTYNNVLKTKDLNENLKLAGLKISIHYTNISTAKVLSNDCTVSSPVIYALKQITVESQGEIR